MTKSSTRPGPDEELLVEALCKTSMNLNFVAKNYGTISQMVIHEKITGT